MQFVIGWAVSSQWYTCDNWVGIADFKRRRLELQLGDTEGDGRRTSSAVMALTSNAMQKTNGKKDGMHGM